ncbi:MAG TPA: hypothetical protein DIW31_06365 [Bacteroidales bacterium]|nr:hypothetical protein [Bacteroidales bacterium]
MKKLALLSFTAFIAFVFFAACQKETEDITKNESILKFTGVKPNIEDVNGTPFTIAGAGIYSNSLYLCLKYIGGNSKHEFIVAWDGIVQQTDSLKFIDLNVYHKNVEDVGTAEVYDSLMLNLKNLNISDELLNDKNLYFNIINSSNLSNVLFIQAYIPDGGGNPTNPNEFENINVEVVEQSECSNGIWSNLWLKDLSRDVYYSPKAVDSTITYMPALNDKLKISFERTWYSDSTYVCPSWQNKVVQVINIKTLEKQ